MSNFLRFAPYVPTPPDVVDGMLRIAGVGPDDVVYDLGSGDGRILVEAVKTYGAKKAVGYEIQDERYEACVKRAAELGLDGKINVLNKNLFDAELSDATVITLYLTSATNNALREKIMAEARTGSRVVSHNFDISEWDISSRADVNGHMIFLYSIPKAFRASRFWKFF